MQTGQNQNLSTNGYSRVEIAPLSTNEMGEMGEPKKKGGMKIRPILGIVWRNIPLIAGIAVSFGVVSLMMVRNSAATYEGNASILVEPITSQARSSDPSAISRAQVQESGSTVDYPTLLQVMQSPELLKKIAAQIQSRYPDVTEASLARDLKNQDFTVTRVGTNILDSTRTIDIAYKGTDAKKVLFILEKLSQGYLRFSLEDRKTRIGGGVEFIEDQLPALQQRVTTLESQVQSLRQRYRVTDPATENQQVREQFRNVQEQRLAAETALREQATLYTTLERQLGLSPELALAAASLSQNTRYQDLTGQLKKVEAQIAIKLAAYEEDSPVVKGLRSQQKNLNQLLGQEAQKNLNSVSPGVVGTSEVLAFQDPVRIDLIKQLVQSANQAKALQARTDEIVKTESALDQRLREFPALVRQYNTLQQQLDIATKTLNQFLLQRETLRVEAAQKEVPWEIISKPKLMSDLKGVPIASRGKKAMQILMGGVVAGIALGLAAALLREKLRNVFVNPEDLQDAVPLPFLGIIPARKGLGGFTDGLTTKLMDPFSDAFSSLYTNLRFLDSGSLIRLVAIGSAEPGDGKTTTALNLAQMAASMGQRVLLVDADLSSPQVHTLLNLSNQRGLTDILHRKTDLEEVIQTLPGNGEDLSVITAGTVQPDSTRLFASTEMQRLSEQLRSRFDLVIFDTPPLQGLTDLNFLTAQTDGMVLVVGVNKTKRSNFVRNLESLKKFRLPIVGLVANHPKKGRQNQSAAAQSISTQSHPAFFGNLNGSTSDGVR
jgi:polysaccharide biosynthesis transport protein